MEFIPYYSLTVVLLFSLYLWHKDHQSMQAERKDLYDRLMSSNLAEYKAVIEEEEPTVAEVPDLGLTSLEDARDELLGDTEEQLNG